MASMNVRSGDTVEIIVGGVDVYGKRGKVIATDPKAGKVMVENLNMVTKHRKPRSATEPGGIIEKARFIDVSNVALVCPKCGETTRVAHVLAENGKKYLRACKKCGAVIDAKAEKKQAKTTKRTSARKKKAEATEE